MTGWLVIPSRHCGGHWHIFDEDAPRIYISIKPGFIIHQLEPPPQHNISMNILDLLDLDFPGPGYDVMGQIGK